MPHRRPHIVMTRVVIFLGCAWLGVGMYALLRLPNWLFSSINLSTLSRLRDQVFDARRLGILPNVPSVAALIERLETFIDVLPSISAVQVCWLRRYDRRLVYEQRVPLVIPLTVDDVNLQQWFADLQDEFGRIVLRQYLIGTWSGLLLVAPRHPAYLRSVLRRRDQDRLELKDHPNWRDCGAVDDVSSIILAKELASARTA